MIPNSKEENRIFLQTSPNIALTCKRLEAQVSFPTTYPSIHIETKQMPAAMWETSQGKFQKSPKRSKKCDPPYYSHKNPFKYGNGSHYWGPLGEVPKTHHLRRGADRIADLFSWCPAHGHRKGGASKEMLGYRGTIYGPYYHTP